ncbi:GNAT family N-acetyltransferase [bacterium]|nr:GNAT family N-acetyltransferase [bacterium]
MSVTIERFDVAQFEQHFDEFVTLLCNVVDHGGSVNFLAPLSRDESAAYWRRVLADLPGGTRILLAARDEGVLVGSVQLALGDGNRTGPHRAEVQKLFVHSDHRGQGIARQLMIAIEGQARAHQRTLLVLDTERGSHAETLYERLGYQRVGIIPGCVLNTQRELTDAVIFYRQLE